MPTCPASSGSKTSLVPVSVLWSLSVTRLFDQSDRLRRDALARAQCPEALGRGRLDADLPWSDPEALGEVDLHRAQVGFQAWLLGDDSAVDVHDAIAGMPHPSGRPLQQLQARRSLPLLICGREDGANVPDRCCSKERVDDRVREHVRIRVAVEPDRVLDQHATEDQLAAGLEPVDVVPSAHPHVLAASCSLISASTTSKSSGVVSLMFAGSPCTTVTSWPVAATSCASSSPARPARTDSWRLPPPAFTVTGLRGDRDATSRSAFSRRLGGPTTTIRSTSSSARKSSKTRAKVVRPLRRTYALLPRPRREPEPAAATIAPTVVKAAHTLAGLLALARDRDHDLLAGDRDRPHRLRQLVEVEDCDAFEPSDPVEIEVVRHDPPAPALGRAHDVRVDLGIGGDVVLHHLHVDDWILLHLAQHVEPATAASPAGCISRVRDEQIGR